MVGFTGSAGTAVITDDKAALFTDGRYFNQASKQLDDNWQLMKVGLLKVPTWQEWVADISSDGKVVGVDPNVFTVGISLPSVALLFPPFSGSFLSRSLL
jgi:Xaa-Pro aminopeptidase